MSRVVLTVMIAVLALSAGAQQKKRTAPNAAQLMVTRPLNDADIEKYCTIAAEIRKLLGPVRTGADSNRMLELTKAVAPKHGLTQPEYNALDSRISMALMYLDMMQNARVPEKSKADCDLVAKHRQRIVAARKFAQ